MYKLTKKEKELVAKVAERANKSVKDITELFKTDKGLNLFLKKEIEIIFNVSNRVVTTLSTAVNNVNKPANKDEIYSTTERFLQSTCIEYFRDNYPDLLVWSSLSGIKLSGSNKYATIQLEKQSGFIRGISDLFIALPNGESLHVELKNGSKGKQSIDQIAMQTKLESLDHTYVLIRTFKEFKEMCNKYIKE
jgi:hypothetical protein